MEDIEHKSNARRKQGRYLLVGSGVLGIASTLRMFGVGAVTPVAAGLLGGATMLALLGLLMTLRSGRIPRDGDKMLIVFLFGVHLVATLFFFPPEDVLNDRPVLTLDHAVHYYQAKRARDLFWESCLLHGYDPYFMAGYPGGAVFDIDTKGAELWCALLRFLSVPRALKLFILLAHLLIVFTIYSGCRRLGYRFEEGVLATFLFIGYWHWGRPFAGHFRFAGMFAFLFVTHLSFYLVGLFRAFLDEEPCRRFFILGPLAFFIHPTAAVLLPAPFLALFLVRRRTAPEARWRGSRRWRLVLRLVAWCALVLGVNALWLVPLLQYLDVKIPSEAFFQIQGVRGFLSVVIKPGNLPAILLMALSLIGFVRLILDRRFTESVAPAAGAAFLIFLSSYGVFLPGFDQLEPGRFLYSAMVFIAPLSGAGLSSILSGLRRILRDERLLSSARTAALLVLFLCPPPLALLEARAYYRHTLSTQLDPEVADLVDALRLHTAPTGRVMIEDGPARLYGDSHIPSILPLFTGVEQIGGPYPFTFIEHHFTTFQLDRTMGKPLASIPPGELLEYIDLYNVRWAVTTTREATAFFRDRLSFDSMWSSRHYALWKVGEGGGFTTEPGISVRAAFGSIRVKIPADLVPSPPDTLLIKYHWDRGLEAKSPARISPVRCLNDPVPLILLVPNGEMDIQITF